MLKRMIGVVATSMLIGIPGASTAMAQVGVSVNVPGLQIRVGHTSPPRLRHERIPPRPSRNAVWLPGSWDWQGNGWVWIPGRWERGAHNGTWIKARYVREGNGWRYEPAHWSSQRLVESDEYHRWHDEQHQDRDHRHQ
ncbi:MAG TPA: YXWGXW repeat-containing protein [Thermoanaerobaculia bacterium]|jgi:hypothetical protein